MNVVLRLEPGGVRLSLTPQHAHDIVLGWLQGREPLVTLTVEQVEQLRDALAEAIASVDGTCPDCGGPWHDGDEADR